MASIAFAFPVGNRCGHDPHHPRWFEPPASHRERPGILRKLMEKARARTLRHLERIKVQPAVETRRM
jgi:hypothetical protein